MDVLEMEDVERTHVYNGSELNPEFTNHHVISKSKEKTLKSDLKSKGFPPEIINKADEIFVKMKFGLKRGVRRKQLVYYCAQAAYNELKIPMDPSQLASTCGISYSEIFKANSMCSPAKTGYKPPSEFKQPKDFIESYYKKIQDMNIISFGENSEENINDICYDVMEKSSELREEKPQTVAAAVLVFYLELNGCVLKKEKYTEIFNKSDMAIIKIKNKVAVVYNS